MAEKVDVTIRIEESNEDRMDEIVEALKGAGWTASKATSAS